MAKVSVDLGLTLKLPKGDNFEFIRPAVSVQEVDVSNVDKELELVRKALPKVWDEASTQLETLLEKEFTDLDVEKKKSLVEVVKVLRNEVKILKEAVLAIEKKSNK